MGIIIFVLLLSRVRGLFGNLKQEAKRGTDIRTVVVGRRMGMGWGRDRGSLWDKCPNILMDQGLLSTCIVKN